MNDQIRDERIDFIKAVSIVMVLIWHLKPITREMLEPFGFIGPWCAQILKIFYYNVTLLAVPTFILISLCLFINKVESTNNYWKRRMLRLSQIFVFWVGIQFILYLLLGGKLPLPLNSIIPGGGPALPYGPSIFYFLFILILSTIYMYFFLKVPEKIKIFLSIVIVSLSCVHFFLAPLYDISIDTQSMNSYYIYIPTAYYLNKHKEQFFQHRWWFFIALVLSLIAEYSWIGMKSSYGRLSIFFGVLFFVSTFISKPVITGRPVKFLAQYSLGIFALHLYVYNLNKTLFAIFKNYSNICLWPIFENLMIFAVTLTLTFLSVYILGKTKLRIYVS